MAQLFQAMDWIQRPASRKARGDWRPHAPDQDRRGLVCRGDVLDVSAMLRARGLWRAAAITGFLTAAAGLIATEARGPGWARGRPAGHADRHSNSGGLNFAAQSSLWPGRIDCGSGGVAVDGNPDH